ncbi:ABC transporter ATP-binding protein, partial [Micromonospora sp. NPDC050397]
MTGTVPAAGPTAAARASDVWKVYGSGEAQVIALRGVTAEFEQG